MKVVIVGAGQTGRGYLGRLAYLSHAQITFVDRDYALIDALKAAGSYRISFFGNQRPELSVQGFSALHIEEAGACDAICNADIVFISVLAENLVGVLPLLEQVRIKSGEKMPPIVVCENGINPSSIFRNTLPASVEITEAVLLCTTCSDGLDIRSQDLDYLPYDRSKLTCDISLEGFKPELNFNVLCRRKIYTYNCLSACICYMGAEKGYERFELAANDPEIKSAMLELRDLLDQAIASEYAVSLDDQKAFSKMAVDKFTDYQMTDSIERNARNVLRKLGPQERLIAPMQIAQRQGENTDLFLRLIAQAMKYGVKEGSISEECLQDNKVSAFLNTTCGIEDETTVKKIWRYYSGRNIL